LKLKQRLPEVFKKSEELHSKIGELFDEYRVSINEWNEKQPDVRSSDNIRKKIDEFFDEKVGDSFTEQKELEEIFKEGEERYKNNIPPGYKDENEKKNKPNFTYAGLNYIPMYGDLIIWKQIIAKAKTENIKSVIFITDDVKEDWWYILDSHGRKEIGVRAELREEIYRESDISSFEVLRTTDFMKSGKEFLELDVHEESITETKSKIESKKRNKVKYNIDNTNKYIKELDGFKGGIASQIVEDSIIKYKQALGVEAMGVVSLEKELLNKMYTSDFSLDLIKSNFMESESEKIMNTYKNRLLEMEQSVGITDFTKIAKTCICGSGVLSQFCCGIDELM